MQNILLIRTCLLQEGTLCGVKKDLYVTRMHVIWGQKDLSLTRMHNLVVKKTCLLQECTLFGVNNDLFITRRDVIWSQKDLSVTIMHLI